MSDDQQSGSSYLDKSKKKKKNSASVTTDSLGVGKEALYDKRNMQKNTFQGASGKSTFGRRSGTR